MADDAMFLVGIVSGRREMAPDASAGAVAQLRLRYRLAASVADAILARSEGALLG